MRYQVPQFINIEDKIFGPLTVKQFLYVAGGVAIGFLIWSALPTILAMIIGIPVVAFFFALAFYQVNGRPFVHTAESAVKFAFGSKLYIWNKKPKKVSDIQKTVADETINQFTVPKISDSKLKELTWSLDIDQNIQKTESETEKGLGLRI